MANGPPSEPPLAQTSGYATDCEGGTFRLAPGAALAYVGPLLVTTRPSKRWAQVCCSLMSDPLSVQQRSHKFNSKNSENSTKKNLEIPKSVMVQHKIGVPMINVKNWTKYDLQNKRK